MRTITIVVVAIIAGLTAGHLLAAKQAHLHPVQHERFTVG